jgi:hypothetical protein
MSAIAQSGDNAAAFFKDEVLNKLADTANVAQFVSFSPGEPQIRFVRLQDDVSVQSLEDAIPAILGRAAEGTVNIRSFDPLQPKSNEFLYGLADAGRVVREVRRLALSGLYTIVNETIDVGDGGVSGVAYAGLLEFAPDDTPRCVDKPGAASFPRELGLRVLERVYGFAPVLDFPSDTRVEFSIHPLRRGVRRTHTIVWEAEPFEAVVLEAQVSWPNRFSRFVGDKAFGLLVADTLGLPVPEAVVVTRRVPPFRFGTSTGTGEHWIRTAPVEQVPGHFTTHRGWLDPFELLAREDPGGNVVASVIAQEGVEAQFSGAAAIASTGLVVEGVRGHGDEFMQGRAAPQPLPEKIVSDVSRVMKMAADHLGPVRLEWVHDGETVWVVQMHRGTTPSFGLTIYPGTAEREHRFPVGAGLDRLRSLVERIRGTGEGVVLVGSVGVTSHLGDVLRRAKVPSRIEVPSDSMSERLFDPA